MPSLREKILCKKKRNQIKSTIVCENVMKYKLADDNLLLGCCFRLVNFVLPLIKKKKNREGKTFIKKRNSLFVLFIIIIIFIDYAYY